MISQEEKKSKYFAAVLPQIKIKTHHNHRSGQHVSFALVPGSKGNDVYAVGIDEHGRAAWCDCKHHEIRGAYCKHMEAVDLHMSILLYDVVADACQIASQAWIDASDHATAEIGNAYEVQAKTFAFGCCGHIVKPQHEGELCGACLCG